MPRATAKQKLIDLFGRMCGPDQFMGEDNEVGYEQLKYRPAPPCQHPSTRLHTSRIAYPRCV
tara:strand:- start:206 stop:391 length:186 start_codon:yes stop_codon:yes gene_type:complete